MNEPSVLDFIKSRLMPWKYTRIEIPLAAEPDAAPQRLDAPGVPYNDLSEQPLLAAEPEALDPRPQPLAALPWPALAALLLALTGQALLGPGAVRGWTGGVTALLLALALLAWSIYRGEWAYSLHPAPAQDGPPVVPPINLTLLATGIFVMLFGYLALMATIGANGEPHFTLLNTALIALATGLVGAAFWQRKVAWNAARGPQPARPRRYWTAWVGPLSAVALVLLFRLYRLGDVPPEMNSDHAEKILDILRVLNGQHLVFFSTNGGREALIFYLGAWLHRLSGLPLGFLALKIVSVTIGLAAMPFIYGVGKEIGGARLGWLAFVLSGIAYWPNVVARFGLRLPFYILFTAALLYFLLRGLRTRRINDFVLAGVTLGLGFYGYTPDRLLPLLVLLALGLYSLHHRPTVHSGPEIHPGSWAHQHFALQGLLALVLVSFVLFVPLMTYIIAQPDAFLARTVTRMADAEQSLQAEPLTIFTRNVGRALTMFSWDSGVIWPTSIPTYPALGMVAGGLFYLGLGLLLVRYLRSRRWPDLLLLLSIPLLQLPSTLSLAFPDENPNLYRTGGVMVPVFVIAALALDGLIGVFSRRMGGRLGQQLGWGLALLLIAFAGLQDYRWVFVTYRTQYLNSAHNTSEMGQAVQSLIENGQPVETVWVMGYPHWVDARLVAINAGQAGRDFRLFIENIPQTKSDPRPKLFLVNLQDFDAQNALRLAYPLGWFEPYPSRVAGREFLIFRTPAESTP